MQSREIVGASFDEIYERLLVKLVRDPEAICAPRGQKIKEALGMNLVLTNPRARLLTCPSRETNYGFAVGEFLWYWQGKQDLETMVYYNKRMKDFSDDGKTLNSAYGWRMKKSLFTCASGSSRSRLGHSVNQLTQWEVAIKTLLDDPDSRRCVLLINTPADEYEAATLGSKDVPCTLSLQFFVRNDLQDGKQKLHLHVHMRSNDAVWGLTYDLFSFTLFQECMIMELREHEKFRDLELGNYYHTAGSIHLYERHFELADAIIKDYAFRPTVGIHQEVEGMKPLGSLADLKLLCINEEALRMGDAAAMVVPERNCLPWMLEQLTLHREKRNAERK